MRLLKPAAWLLAGMLLLVSTSSWSARGLMFEVTRDGVLAGYLVGTMHSEDERVIGQMERLSVLMEQVDSVALELVPDAITMMAVGAATLLPPHQSLHQMIGDERFEQILTYNRMLQWCDQDKDKGEFFRLLGINGHRKRARAGSGRR